MQSIYKLLIAAVTSVALLTSCEKESDPLREEGQMLQIRVEDAGYTSQDPDTKATDTGFKTTFEDGDKIGVFVVDADGSVTYPNVPVTLKSGVWVDETQGVRIKKTTSRVFAYYPYVEDVQINGKINASAEDASAFFANYLISLDISDQSTLSRYRQADVLGCMVEKSEISDNQITFSMSHLMGLVVLDFDVKQPIHYTLEEDAEYTWTRYKKYTVTPLFDHINMLEENGVYRYLVNPASLPSISGSFETEEGEKSFSFTPSSLLGGDYKSYRITASISEGRVTHTLAVGDIFKSDGGLISQKELDETGISEEEKEECVGIVFSTTSPYSQDNELDSKFKHGLVMALKDASSSSQWKISNGGDESLTNCESLDQCRADLGGFSNSKHIWDTYSGSLGTYPAFEVAKSYTTELSEGKTSGWFLPSIGQWIEILANLGEKSFKAGSSESITNTTGDIYITGAAKTAADNIDNHLNKIGGSYVDKIGYTGSTILFWSSSEYSCNGARYVSFYSNGGLRLNYSLKTYGYRVRCVLAF